jgi:hypothetical protein
MSLARLTQLKDRLSIEDDSEDEALRQIMASAASIMERQCNRYFGRLISNVETANSLTTITCIGHELEDGDTVRISGFGVAGLNADHEVTVVDENSFTVAEVADANGSGSGFLRRHFIVEKPTGDDDTIFLDPRPVAAIIEVKEAESRKSGNWGDALAATKYHLPTGRGGVSSDGALIRVGSNWPKPKEGKLYNYRVLPSGAKVTFVAGSKSIPPAITNALITLTGTIRRDQSEESLKSESYEDYSYSRFSSAELAELPGSVQNVILQHRYPTI